MPPALLTFRKPYFHLTLGLLLVEIGIAVFVHDAIIRPYIGDFLAVIFVYCLLRSCLALRVWPLALAALGISYLIEIGLLYPTIFQSVNKQGFASTQQPLRRV